MIKIFADTSNIDEIRELNKNPLISGFTTNPSLMRKAGVLNYKEHCRGILAEIGDKPVSFEVLADTPGEIERQARIIASWADNIYVKIPITTTNGSYLFEVIRHLVHDGIKVNVTAVTEPLQAIALPITKTPMIVSYFAGRVADTGRDPVLGMKMLRQMLDVQLLWGSPREALNVYEAEQAGADIITMTPELIKKYQTFKGMDLRKLSLITVKQFYDDGKLSGYDL